MHPDNETAYEAVTVRCHACAEQATKAAAFSENGGDLEGLYFGVQRHSR